MASLTTTALAGGSAAAVGSLWSWAVRGRSSAVFGPSVWHGPRDQRGIALTFDDGPSETTPQILDILAQHKIRATFFQCGANVARLPAIAREVNARGHEIGNHTQTHRRLYLHSGRFIEQELRQAQQTIELYTGVTPRWFRAPFGVRWFGLRQAQRQLHLTGVMWTVIGYDWSLDTEQVVDRVSRGVSNGAIICLHDGRELRTAPDVSVTVEAVRRLVPELLEKRYRFQTLTELICPTISPNAS